MDGPPANDIPDRHRAPVSITVDWLIPTHKRDFNRMPASVWIRCLQLIPYLEERGVRCRVNQADGRGDIAVFVRWQDREAQRLARRLKDRGQRVVFDLCVNYFDETGHFDGGYGSRRQEVTECARMAEVADAITCASAFIAQRAAEHHPRAVYLSDSIDMRHFRLAKDPGDFRRPHLRAIFSGVTQKSRELEPILPLLQRRGIPLTVISNGRPELSTPYSFVQWSYESFPHDILSGEICLTCRPVDNPYNRGHSLFKIGVFMSQGVPAIASPLPSYQEIIREGTGGRLCDSAAAWEEALDSVLEDRELLVRWSQEARSNLAEYATDRMIEGYLELFKTLCERDVTEKAQLSQRESLVGSSLSRIRHLLRSGLS